AGIGPAGVDPQVAALAPSQLGERLRERCMPGLSLGVVRGEIREHADAPHILALLCPRRQWPRGRAANQRDELAPTRHSITSSAVASRVGGTARSSILAVQALITNSNLIDCTTGKSAGFAPLRMRPA